MTEASAQSSVFRVDLRLVIVAAGFGLFAILFALSRLHLFTPNGFSSLLLTVFLAIALIFATISAVSLGDSREADIDSKGAPKVRLDVYLCLVFLPGCLLLLSQAPDSLQAAWPWPVLKLVVLAGFAACLVAALRQLSVSSGAGLAECAPIVVSYASLIILLGDAGSFGYLVELLPAQLLDTNAFLRKAAFGLLVIMFLSLVAIDVVRRIADGEFVAPDWATLNEKRLEPGQDLSVLSLMSRAISDGAVVMVDAVGYLLRLGRAALQLGLNAAIAVVRNAVELRRLTLGSLLALQVTLTLLLIVGAPSLAAIFADLAEIGTFELKQAIYMVGFFTWLGASLLGVSVASMVNSRKLSAYGILNTMVLSAGGVWLFSFSAHLAVAFGADLPGYRPRHDHVLLLGGALGLAGAIILDGQTSTVRKRVALLAAVAVLAYWTYAYLNRSAETPARRPTVASAAAARTDGSAFSYDWVIGSWGLDGDCRTPLTIKRRSSDLIVSLAGSTRSTPVESLTDTSVVTPEGTYRRDGDSLVFDAEGTQLRLVKCG